MAAHRRKNDVFRPTPRPATATTPRPGQQETEWWKKPRYPKGVRRKTEKENVGVGEKRRPPPPEKPDGSRREAKRDPRSHGDNRVREEGGHAGWTGRGLRRAGRGRQTARSGARRARRRRPPSEQWAGFRPRSNGDLLAVPDLFSMRAFRQGLQGGAVFGEERAHAVCASAIRRLTSSSMAWAV